MNDHPAWPGTDVGLLGRIARQKLWFLLGFVGTVGVVAAAWSALPRTYRATAAAIVASDDNLVTGQSAAQAQRLGDPADIESQMLLLRSPATMGRILERPDVSTALVTDCQLARDSGWLAPLRAHFIEPKPCSEMATSRQAGLDRLDAGFAIGPTGRSRVLSVSFTATDPEAAALIANALVDTYLATDRSQKVVTREAAIEWLNGEIVHSGDALRQAEMAVEAYRRENGLVRGQWAAISSERLTSLNQQLVTAEAAQAQAWSRLQQLAGSPGNSREVLDNRAVADLKQQMTLLTSQYALAAERLGPRHPDLISLTRQRAALESQMDSEVAAIRSSISRELEAANARVGELRRQYDGVKLEVGDTGGAEAGIATLVRNVEARREIFIDLSKKANTLETERRLLSGDARLVNHAEVPSRVWFPKTLPFVAVGTVLATVMGAGAALLRDRGDRRVRGAGTLVALSGVPIIGQIPRSRRLLGGRTLPQQISRQKPLQDAVRGIFGELVLRRGTAPQVLLIASAESGEGKTFLSLALAHFAAGAGRRVLAVECDLRRPGFQAALRMPPRQGLTEHLRGMISLTEAIATDLPGGFDVLMAGRPAIDSLELLSGRRMNELMETIRGRYDLIILDSPPSTLLVDARMLARHADGVIYCASAGKSNIDAVVDGMHAMQESGSSVLGVALGMVRPRDIRSYDGARRRPSRFLAPPETAA